jgi:hypothetical protein
VQHSFAWPELNSASERLNAKYRKKPNIDFDQKSRARRIAANIGKLPELFRQT